VAKAGSSELISRKRYETSFLDFAKSELDRRFGSVRKNKNAVRGHDALKRDRVRIKAKKLRYMAEFLKPLVPGKAFAQTSKELTVC
jgi:CHAD domain-containing protein